MNPASIINCPGRRPPSRRLLLWWVILMAIGLCAAAPRTQTAADKKPVYVTASFLDRNDLFIENLQKSEVEILENDQPRQIELMAQEELPTVFGIVFDRSMLPETEESERPGRQSIPDSVAARDISYQLIDKQLGHQTLWVGVFDRELQIAFDASSDGFGAKNAIHQLRGRHTTETPFLYSALFSAVKKMNQRHEKRRVIILFIQALDSETAGKMRQLKNLLASSNVELFAICFASRLGGGGTLASAATTSALKELTQVTSGHAFFTMEYRDHFEDIVRRMLNHLQTLYTFGFTSESASGEPGKLAIKCSRPRSKVRCHPNVPALE